MCFLLFWLYHKLYASGTVCILYIAGGFFSVCVPKPGGPLGGHRKGGVLSSSFCPSWVGEVLSVAHHPGSLLLAGVFSFVV